MAKFSVLDTNKILETERCDYVFKIYSGDRRGSLVVNSTPGSSRISEIRFLHPHQVVHNYSHLIFDKEEKKTYPAEKTASSTNVLGNLDVHMQERD